MGRSFDEWKQQARQVVDANADRLAELSARIHATPELKHQEHQAAGWLAEYLEQNGLQVERGAFGMPTAFAARAGSGSPTVAILCEYDALPGVGHACGHNIIAAAGAGAGVAVARIVHETGGSVLVLGTPAEEGGGGKIVMGRNGAFDGVDAAMMVHPAGLDVTGMTVLAVSEVVVEYRGRAAHASASPHRGVNALDAMVIAYSAIAQLRQHIRSTERIHGIITDGGQAANIVPERAAGLFMIRAGTEARLRELKKRVEGCFQAGAAATGAELRLDYHSHDYADMWTNGPLVDAYASNLEALGRRVTPLAEIPDSVAGSTDMGNVSKWVPSIHPMIAVAPPHVPLHSTEFARYAGSEAGVRASIDGAKALAMTAVDVLLDAELRRRMAEEFTECQLKSG